VKSRKWLVILILILVGYLVWKYLWPKGADDADLRKGDNPALILDRVWVDSNPERYTDYVHAMLVLSDVPMGLFQKASAYRMELELFEFKRDNNKLVVHFPQSDSGKRVKYTISHCNDLPPFDLCLDLSANPWQGPKRYYSVSDSDQARALLGDRYDELAARLRTAP